jgi:SAM-dependent methyltransferase
MIVNSTELSSRAGKHDRVYYNKLHWQLSLLYYRHLPFRDRNKALRLLHNCQDIDSILRTDDEVEASVCSLRSLKLPLRSEWSKNWDAYRAFSFIMRFGNSASRVLDVGCGNRGVVLPWLELYGFSHLYGCDISFGKGFTKGRIQYSRQDLQRTNFDSDWFDFVTSLSVIEHGVDLRRYFEEMHRLLKPGGFLLTSTDYWPDPIDTRGLYPYGSELGEMKIFTRADIEHLIQIASAHGLMLIEPVDFSYRDKVVYWERVDRRFTFIFLVMRNNDVVDSP